VAFTVNCHSDFLCHAIGSYRQHDGLLPLRQWQEKLAAGGVDAVFCAVGGDADTFPLGYSQTRAYFETANRLVERFREHFQVAHTAEELVEARYDEHVALFLGLEGCRALEGQLETLEALHGQGLRWLSLTWNDANELGDGIGETKHGGLTAFGKQVIEQAHRLGIVVDLVHASRNTFWDAMAVGEAPLIISHSNAATICPHLRNLTDDQIRNVGSTSGVVGINFYPRFLTVGTPQWADIERHICHIADLIGADHVALGPDFIDFSPEDVARSLSKSTIDYGRDFSYPSGFSDDSCFRNIATKLRKTGFDDSEVAGIMGRNMVRVVKKIERVASTA
jgi:membrane dipeptidase